MMKKLVKLTIIILGLGVLTTTANALEDGSYRCIITEIEKGDLTKKLPEKDYEQIGFTIKDQTLNDGDGTYKYYITIKGIDVYENKNFFIFVPSDDQGNEPFNFTFEDRKDGFLYKGYCIKIGKKVK